MSRCPNNVHACGVGPPSLVSPVSPRRSPALRANPVEPAIAALHSSNARSHKSPPRNIFRTPRAPRLCCVRLRFARATLFGFKDPERPGSPHTCTLSRGVGIPLRGTPRDFPSVRCRAVRDTLSVHPLRCAGFRYPCSRPLARSRRTTSRSTNGQYTRLSTHRPPKTAFDGSRKRLCRSPVSSASSSASSATKTSV